jgi:hypothetical protein
MDAFASSALHKQVVGTQLVHTPLDVRKVAIMECNHAGLDDVSMPGRSVGTNRLVTMIAVDPQQSDVCLRPRLSGRDRWQADHGYALTDTGARDIGVEGGLILGAELATENAAKLHVRVHRVDAAAVAKFRTQCQGNARSTTVGTDFDNDLSCGYVPRQRHQLPGFAKTELTLDTGGQGNGSFNGIGA